VRRANEIWREIEAQTPEKLFLRSGGLVIGPRRDGAAFHAQSDFVSSTVNVAGRFGIEHEVLNAEQIRKRFPALIMRDDEYAYYEAAGGVLRPEKCIQAQLDLAKGNNARIQTNEIVLSYDATPSGVTVRTDLGEYRADKVILAAGSWMIDLLDPTLRQYFKVYRQVIYWFAAQDIRAFYKENFPFLIWIGNDMNQYFSVFPTPADGIQGVKVLTEQYHEAVHPDEIQRAVSQDEIEQMYGAFVKQRLSGVTDRCIDAGVCMYTVTPDEHFVVDFDPASDRVLVASPCSGHGFKHSAAIGEALSQMALDGRSQLDVRPFSLSRFT
jgi:sarcosine oxidase